MDNLIAAMKEGFQRQVDDLQAEVFDFRRELDKERSAKKRIHENSAEISYLNSMVQVLREKNGDLEEAQLNDNVVLDINSSEEMVSDPGSTFLTDVNKALMGNIIAKDDIKMYQCSTSKAEIKYPSSPH